MGLEARFATYTLFRSMDTVVFATEETALHQVGLFQRLLQIHFCPMDRGMFGIAATVTHQVDQF